MIFHCPFPVTAAGAAGSQIRPYAMLQAFRALGIDVAEVTGTTAERVTKIAEIRRQHQQGRAFAFAYSESATAPILWGNRSSAHPFIDYQLLSWLQQQSCPVGLYYRDIHWRFNLFGNSISYQKKLIMRMLYWHEWFVFRRRVSKLFLPSLRMIDHLPTTWPQAHVLALPPGCTVSEQGHDSNQRTFQVLHLFYVGGVSPPLYDLSLLFQAIKPLDFVHLTLCCRKPEWDRVKDVYMPLLGDNLQIVHESGDALVNYYATADIFSYACKPHPYLDFAMPVKIFETLGQGLPLIVTANTAAAQFVEQENIGWSVSSEQNLQELLNLLHRQPQLILEKRQNTEQARHQNTWLTRAQTVAEIMMKANVS